MNSGFKSVLNFRDIGGTPAYNGWYVRKGILFRSASPDRISKQEFRDLQKLGINVIFDLRADKERKRRIKEFEKVEVISFPLDFEEKTRENLLPLIYKKNSENEIDKISASLYLEILDASAPVLNAILKRLISGNSGAVLIHCQAGKDRTGVISALIQMALGVDRETIVREFLRSNDEILPFFRKMLLLKKILRFGFLPTNTILYAIKVKKNNIESVLDRVNIHYGGIEPYLLRAGLEKENLAGLRKRMLSR